MVGSPDVTIEIVAGDDALVDPVAIRAGGVVCHRPGVAEVRAAFGGHDLDLTFEVTDRDCGNNAPNSELPRVFAGRPGSELRLDAAMSWDLDARRGEESEMRITATPFKPLR